MEKMTPRAISSLLLRNLIFTILQPGIVAGLIPFWILGIKEQKLFRQPLLINHYSGAILFGTGLVVMLSCILNFALMGKGTLSPADPTKRLVKKGLYTYSRNPMYMGVILILTGESIYFQSIYLCIYTLIIWVIFHLFIIFIEEPRLRRDFGTGYNHYCQKVRRWI